MYSRKRGPFLHIIYGTHGLREQVLTWKKAGNADEAAREPAPAIPEFFAFLENNGVAGIDLVTVPPPSFHDYEHAGGWYPAQALFTQGLEAIGQKLSILWPDRYKKKGKVWHQNIDKTYPAPALEVSGRFVLILDDIATTGNTLTAAGLAVIKAGGYPVGVALC
jgi:hypothetical protein